MNLRSPLEITQLDTGVQGLECRSVVRRSIFRIQIDRLSEAFGFIQSLHLRKQIDSRARGRPST